MQQGGMSKSETGLQNLQSGWMKNGEDGQGQAYRIPKTDQMVKVRIGNRKAIQ